MIWITIQDRLIKCTSSFKTDINPCPFWFSLQIRTQHVCGSAFDRYFNHQSSNYDFPFIQILQEQMATQVVFNAGHMFTDWVTALQTEQIWMKQICDCPIPRWHHRRSCELPRRSCRTWARPSAGTRKSCRQVLRLRCDLRRGREKSSEQQSGQRCENLNLINCFSIFAAASRAVRNTWHQKCPPELLGGFSFRHHRIQAAHFLSVRLFCLPFPWCARISPAPVARLEMFTQLSWPSSFVGRHIEEDGSWLAAILITPRKITSHLRRESGALLILFFLILAILLAYKVFFLQF